MSASFVDRLDRFVRWFFNSSPTAVIEPRPSRQPRPSRPPPPTRATERKRSARTKRSSSGNDPALRSRKAVQS